jgi:hypothetical protein
MNNYKINWELLNMSNKKSYKNSYNTSYKIDWDNINMFGGGGPGSESQPQPQIIYTQSPPPPPSQPQIIYAQSQPPPPSPPPPQYVFTSPQTNLNVSEQDQFKKMDKKFKKYFYPFYEYLTILYEIPILNEKLSSIMQNNTQPPPSIGPPPPDDAPEEDRGRYSIDAKEYESKMKEFTKFNSDKEFVSQNKLFKHSRQYALLHILKKKVMNFDITNLPVRFLMENIRSNQEEIALLLSDKTKIDYILAQDIGEINKIGLKVKPIKEITPGEDD